MSPAAELLERVDALEDTHCDLNNDGHLEDANAHLNDSRKENPYRVEGLCRTYSVDTQESSLDQADHCQNVEDGQGEDAPLALEHQVEDDVVYGEAKKDDESDGAEVGTESKPSEVFSG